MDEVQFTQFGKCEKCYMEDEERKCNSCIRWPLMCELDGNFRRGCIKLKYHYYKKAEPVEFSYKTFKR